MRGEHNFSAMTPSYQAGSSPHARGTRCIRAWLNSSAGTIPACAGNTASSTSTTVSNGDHPRMRGEHGSVTSRYLSPPGSSPHARGTLLDVVVKPSDGGIIPACAGNTTPSPPHGAPPWDHPRMRGEHAVGVPSMARVPGSSPHARGTRGERRDLVHVVGIIPACAGNTRRR